MENRIALDSALVRCNADRERTLDDPECMNARRAVARLATIREDNDRARREAEFERKRAALRVRRQLESQRRQDAQDQRMRDEEAAREAAAYGIVEDPLAENPTGEVPNSTASPDEYTSTPSPDEYTNDSAKSTGEVIATPVTEAQPTQEPPPAEDEGMTKSDLESEIKLLEDELKRRREQDANPNTGDSGN